MIFCVIFLWLKFETHLSFLHNLKMANKLNYPLFCIKGGMRLVNAEHTRTMSSSKSFIFKGITELPLCPFVKGGMQSLTCFTRRRSWTLNPLSTIQAVFCSNFEMTPQSSNMCRSEDNPPHPFETKDTTPAGVKEI